MTGIPGGVKDDNTVGADQVHPQAASSRGDEEQLDVGVGVEIVDEPLALQRAGAPVQAVVVHTQSPPLLIKDLKNIKYRLSFKDVLVSSLYGENTVPVCIRIFFSSKFAYTSYRYLYGYGGVPNPFKRQ